MSLVNLNNYIYLNKYECRCSRGSEVLDLPELELQAIVNNLTWVLGTELGSSARPVHALNHWAIAPAPEIFIFNNCIAPAPFQHAQKLSLIALFVLI